MTFILLSTKKRSIKISIINKRKLATFYITELVVFSKDDLLDYTELS